MSSRKFPSVGVRTRDQLTRHRRAPRLLSAAFPNQYLLLGVYLPSAGTGTWPCSCTAPLAVFDSASASDKLLQYSGSGFVLIKLKDYYAPDTEVMKCLLVKQTKCTGFLFCEEVILEIFCHNILGTMIQVMVSTKPSNLIRPRLENFFFPVLWIFLFFKSY